MPACEGDVTGLLQQLRTGDSDAANRLMPIVIQELHRLAQYYLSGEHPGHTLQPTALGTKRDLRTGIHRKDTISF